MTDGQRWAHIVRDGSSDGGVRRIISAINRETLFHRANRADVTVACAQILAQSIVGGGPEIAGELRSSIISLIDGFSLQTATLQE